MRKPKERGKRIDKNRIDQWVVRFPGYRQEVTARRISDWIAQFAASDGDLAARVLDCVHYVTYQSIEEAFQQLLEHLDGWNRDENRRTGTWRFVAFSRAAGESGDTMLHKWRTATKMTGKKYNALYINKADLLRENLGPHDTVVFLDDFAGTGDQVCKGWKEVMEELLPGEPTIYLILVAVTTKASQRIGKETPMKVVSHMKLRDDDNIFSTECKHFTATEKVNLLTYCRRADRRDPKGYGACGLVIVLAHKTPNNSIPILHAKHNRWVGLFPRQ